MAKTYDEIVKLVIRWSNKDPEAYSINDETTYTRETAGVIADFLQYAADKAYRTLRVPSLEFSRIFEVEESDLQPDPVNLTGSTIDMPVPHDMIEVMHIRNVTKGFVYNEKIDMRTFFDRYAEKDSINFWTRQGNVFKVSGRTTPGDEIELHYYRRLPAMDATYNVVAATYNINSSLFLGPGSGTATGSLYFPTGTMFTFEAGTNVATKVNPTLDNYDNTGDPDNLFVAKDSDVDVTYTDTNGVVQTLSYAVEQGFIGVEIEHWLRDENERVVLFGALAEAFAYLEEDPAQQKYMQMFQMEIDELNREEKMRMHKGGNVKRSFNGRGLI